MSQHEEPPPNPYLIAPAKRDRDGYLTVTRCPFCKRKHWHGITAGWHVPHCDKGFQYYVLEMPEEKPPHR
jgi:hypothetical protein